MMENPPAPVPNASSRPMVNSIPHSVGSSGTRKQPAANSSAPPHKILRAPKRSASTPVTGCATPHISWNTAITRLNCATDKAVVFTTGCTNSPSDIRMPMVTNKTKAAAAISGHGLTRACPCVSIDLY